MADDEDVGDVICHKSQGDPQYEPPSTTVQCGDAFDASTTLRRRNTPTASFVLPIATKNGAIQGAQEFERDTGSLEDQRPPEPTPAEKMRTYGRHVVAQAMLQAVPYVQAGREWYKSMGENKDRVMIILSIVVLTCAVALFASMLLQFWSADDKLVALLDQQGRRVTSDARQSSAIIHQVQVDTVDVLDEKSDSTTQMTLVYTAVESNDPPALASLVRGASDVRDKRLPQIVTFPIGQGAIRHKMFFSAEELDEMMMQPCRVVTLEEIHSERIFLYPNDRERTERVHMRSAIKAQEYALKEAADHDMLSFSIALAPKAWAWQYYEPETAMFYPGEPRLNPYGVPAFNPCMLSIRFSSGATMTLVNPQPVDAFHNVCPTRSKETETFYESYESKFDLFNYWRGRLVTYYESLSIVYDDIVDGSVKTMCLTGDDAYMMQFWLQVLNMPDSFAQEVRSPVRADRVDELNTIGAPPRATTVDVELQKFAGVDEQGHRLAAPPPGMDAKITTTVNEAGVKERNVVYVSK